MYTHDRRVTYSEISMKGFADIAQIAEYFQDCSVFQSEVLGMGLTYMNVVAFKWCQYTVNTIIRRTPCCKMNI